MKISRTLPLIFLAGLLPTMAAAVINDMQPLSEEAMSGISGQQGVALNIELRINMKEDGQPVDPSECPNVGALTGGSSCRLGLMLSDLPGAWITLKGFRGMNKFTNIRLDASTFGGNSIHRDITTYMGGYNPNNKPAIAVTAGNWATACTPLATAACNTYLNTPLYLDYITGLSLERLSAEFDLGATPGYMRDAVAGAPISLRLAHGNSLVPDPNNPPNVIFGPYGNEPAKIRLDGQFQLHGFGY